MANKKGTAGTVRTRVLVIGTGFSGIGMGIALKQAGVDFLIIEKANDIGGTWRDNTYPGCRCDIPSHLYSFSFAPKADWKEIFPSQPDIEDYLLDVVYKYRLRQHIEFGVKAEEAHWDDDKNEWRVQTADGRVFIAQFVVSGAGALHIPSVPDIPGRDEFAGPAFHSSEWRHDVELTGKRVAVIGTGASAIQLIPEILEDVAELQVYQRTPPWVVPSFNGSIPWPVRYTLSHVPGTRLASRFAFYCMQEWLAYGMVKRPQILKVVNALGRMNIRRGIHDKELRKRLTPNYLGACKRILKSDDYYPAIDDSKTELVTDGIARMTPHGIVTKDGTERPVDVVIWATGFHVTDSYRYFRLYGRNGEDLVERADREGIQAHRGTMFASVPNVFTLLGPNTGLGHNSVVIMIEAQIKYIIQAIQSVDKSKAVALAPTQEATDRWNDQIQHRLQNSVWETGGCNSWYVDEHGVNRTLYPGYTFQFRSDVKTLDQSEFEYLFSQ